MMLKSAPCKPDQLILQIIDLGNAAATEELGLDWIFSELRLGGIDDDLSVLHK